MFQHVSFSVFRKFLPEQGKLAFLPHRVFSASRIWRENGQGYSHLFQCALAPPPSGCVLMHFFGVRSVPGTCCKHSQKWISRACRPDARWMIISKSDPALPAGQRRISRLCEKTDAIGRYVLFVAAAVCGAQNARTWH